MDKKKFCTFGQIRLVNIQNSIIGDMQRIGMQILSMGLISWIPLILLAAMYLFSSENKNLFKDLISLDFYANYHLCKNFFRVIYLISVAQVQFKVGFMCCNNRQKFLIKAAIHCWQTNTQQCLMVMTISNQNKSFSFIQGTSNLTWVLPITPCLFLEWFSWERGPPSQLSRI